MSQLLTAENTELRRVAVDQVVPSRHHVRGWSEVSEEFVQSVDEVGIIEKPIIRKEDGRYAVLDGLRRCRAAHRAGVNDVVALAVDVDDGMASRVAFTGNLNHGAWNKDVTKSDETTAVNRLANLRATEPDDERLRLGLLTPIERATDLYGHVPLVGEKTALALYEEFGEREAVCSAERDELLAVDGVGERTADNIQEVLCGSGVVVHDDW